MTRADPTLGRLLGSWGIEPLLAAALIAAGLLYMLGVARITRRWPVWRGCAFMAGLFVLALSLMSGIDSYADLLLSVHMGQHMLLALVAPTLLLLGAPVRLALGCRSRARGSLVGVLASRPVHLLSKPAVGLAAFAAVVLTTHLTGLYELALRSASVHALEHAGYFWAGLLLLAPLIAADPLPHPPTPLARFCWLLGAMAAMAIPGALLTFSEHVRYGVYLRPARALGRSALADQHLAGVIMWVGGGLVMFALALAVAGAAMAAEERRQRRRDLVTEGVSSL
jgi:cytochrome c oxidase assembly factor CtaG